MYFPFFVSLKATSKTSRGKQTEQRDTFDHSYTNCNKETGFTISLLYNILQ